MFFSRWWLLTGLCLPLAAQPARPRIGVALAGGSAYGLAHVGVLEWLEENRIPIDAIAGTSMGGLIGGLYATGHSSREIREFISQVNWREALAGGAPYRQLHFRRKEDAIDFPALLELGYKKGIRLPFGLSPGHGVGLVLSRFAAPYASLTNFDELPTPFRCTATDLVEGKPVVFDSGDLFEALRATMSLPAVFAPVRRGKQLLVDGGLLNNLPVDLVRSMKVDLVIAVAIDPPRNLDEYPSLVSLAGRSISVMVADNERRQLGAADVVVMPDLKGFSSTDYARYDELRKAGYAGAQQKAMLLRRLALTDEEYQRLTANRQAKRRPANTLPQRVEIEGDLAPKRKEALIANLTRSPDQPIERGVLESELTRVTGLGRFEAASYSFLDEASGPGLRVRIREKGHGPPFLRPLIQIDGNNVDGLRLGVGGRLTFLDPFGPASEWRTDFSVGALNRLATEYYWRIRGGKWFLAPRGVIDRRVYPLVENGTKLLDFNDRRLEAAVDLGYAFGRFQEARIGYSIGQLNTKIASGIGVASGLQGRTAALTARWVYDGQDAPNVPRHGVRVSANVSYFQDYPGIRKQFFLGSAVLSYAHPLKGDWSLLTRSSGGATTPDPALFNAFSLGGLLQLSHLRQRESLGNQFYHHGTYVLRSLASKDLGLFGRFYGLTGYEFGKAWWSAQNARPRSAGVLGLVGETQFGVIFLGASIGDQGDKKLLVRLGRFF